MTNEKKYLLIDLQDTSDFWEGTLQDIKEWYIEFMEDCPEFEDLEEQDEEWQAFKSMVANADLDRMIEQVNICEYHIEEA